MDPCSSSAVPAAHQEVRFQEGLKRDKAGKPMMNPLSSGLPVFDSNLDTAFGLQEHHASRHCYARQHGPDAVGTRKTSRKDRYPSGDRGGCSPLRVRPAVEPQMALRAGSGAAESARGQ